MVRVIGIDPGLGTTGYGIIDEENGKMKLRSYGTIRPPQGKPLSERLDFLFSRLVELVEQYQPSFLALEDSFFSRNVKSALLLGQARGVLLLAGARMGLTCREYAPRKIKQSLTGNGAAQKQQVQFMVQNLLRLKEPPQPLDSSDALAVAICHLNQGPTHD